MEDENIILFDGVCNLCNGFINFIIDHDVQNQFRFASLQSNLGKEVLVKYNINTKSIYTIVLLHKQSALTKSDAVLMICKKLGGILALAYIFIIIPASFRNSLYDIIAKNRYVLFGKQVSCRVPSVSLKHKFIS